MATTKRTTKKAPARKRAATTKKAPARKTTARKRTTRKAASAPPADPDREEAAAEAAPAAAHVAPPASSSPVIDRPPLRPGARRGVFFDVENTSRAEDVERVLRHLAIDFAHGPLEFTAVGNWRVIGHEPARQLAAHGASLVHSAPSTGVRDWSDLRIAVAAGVWLAHANPGDVVEIVSDDQAFDAVGDVAASLGVIFRRLSYRSLAGIAAADEPEADEPAGARGRRRRRGGRRNGRRRPGTAASSAAREPVRRAPEPEPEADVDVETAPVDEVVGVVQDLVAASPGGVTTLDAVAAALRSRGFRRRAGSPRLITRLKLIKDIEVGRDGRIRMGGEAPFDDAGVTADVPLEAVDEPMGEAGTSGGRRRRRRRRRPRGGAAGDGGVDAAAG